MKNKAAIFAILIVSLFAAGLAPVSAGKAKAAPQEDEVQENAKVKAFNDILFKLVRQDEYLDEALEILDTASGRPGPQDLAALRVTLKTVSKNIKHISALNKAEFTRIDSSDPELVKYTNTILSYSRKVDRKAARLASAAAQFTASNKKAAMRDAVSSRKKGSKRKTSGRKLTQILEEQKAMDSVSAEIRNLRSASRGLSATSNWLYIASK